MREKIIGLFKKKIEDENNKVCPMCKNYNNISSITEERFKREFQISGLCQDCQKYFFGDK